MIVGSDVLLLDDPDEVTTSANRRRWSETSGRRGSGYTH